MKLQRNKTRFRNQFGAGMAEYALVVSLIALISMAATRNVGTNVNGALVKASCGVAGGTGGYEGCIAAASTGEGDEP